ncbi:MAG: Yip1 family protein, partial [Candidatus Binataceae bacterium]
RPPTSTQPEANCHDSDGDTMSDVSLRGLSPFVNIIARPRQTIRAIVDLDPRLHVVPIALVAGGLSAIPPALLTSASSAGQNSGPVTVVLLTVLGAFSAVSGLYIFGWLLAFTGRQLGGKATVALVRAAVGWANVPGIVGSLAAIAALATGVIAVPGYDPEPAFRAGRVFSGLNTILLGFAVWSFSVSLVCLSEVNGFSVLRALLAYFLIAVEVGIVLAILLFILIWSGNFAQ